MLSCQMFYSGRLTKSVDSEVGHDFDEDIYVGEINKTIVIPDEMKTLLQLARKRKREPAKNLTENRSLLHQQQRNEAQSLSFTTCTLKIKMWDIVKNVLIRCIFYIEDTGLKKIQSNTGYYSNKPGKFALTFRHSHLLFSVLFFELFCLCKCFLFLLFLSVYKVKVTI